MYFVYRVKAGGHYAPAQEMEGDEAKGNQNMTSLVVDCTMVNCVMC